MNRREISTFGIERSDANETFDIDFAHGLHYAFHRVLIERHLENVNTSHAQRRENTIVALQVFGYLFWV